MGGPCKVFTHLEPKPGLALNDPKVTQPDPSPSRDRKVGARGSHMPRSLRGQWAEVGLQPPPPTLSRPTQADITPSAALTSQLLFHVPESPFPDVYRNLSMRNSYAFRATKHPSRWLWASVVQNKCSRTFLWGRHGVFTDTALERGTVHLNPCSVCFLPPPVCVCVCVCV